MSNSIPMREFNENASKNCLREERTKKLRGAKFILGVEEKCSSDL